MVVKECLAEMVLPRIYAGDASEVERAHLAACPWCAGRLRAVERDMDVVGRALQLGPVGSEGWSGVGEPSRRWGTWAPVATAAGVAAALGLWLATSFAPWPGASRAPVGGAVHAPAAGSEVAAISPAELVAAASEVSAALFDADDGGSSGFPERVPSYLYASAALGGDWPCSDSHGMGSACNGL